MTNLCAVYFMYISFVVPLQGMCFCQYVLHRELEDPPVSVVEAVKDRVTSMKKNAFSRSHRRKTNGSQVYLSPYSNNRGVAHFV